MLPAAINPSLPPHSPRLLIVDDEPLVRRSAARVLHRLGYLADHAPDTNSALSLAHHNSYDVVLVDNDLPEPGCLSLMSQLRALQPLCMPVLMSGASEIDLAVEALHQAEITSILKKPFNPSSLADVVSRALARQARVRPLLEGQLQARRSAELLEECFQQNCCYLALQPIVATQDWKQIVAMECLLRSRHPILCGPEPILHAAERSRKVWELGLVVNQLAATCVAHLPDPTLLFVNMHPQQFKDPNLLAQFAPLLPYAHRVVLEITERASLSAIPDWDKAVALLISHGFRFAIDDLGSGYNGLLLLAQLRPSFIKVDQSMVRGIHKDPIQQRLVSLLVSFAESTNAPLIAEGVETAEESQALIACGAHLLQGYFIARPAPSPY